MANNKFVLRIHTYQPIVAGDPLAVQAQARPPLSAGSANAITAEDLVEAKKLADELGGSGSRRATLRSQGMMRGISVAEAIKQIESKSKSRL